MASPSSAEPEAPVAAHAPARPHALRAPLARWLFALVPALALLELVAQGIIQLRVPRASDWHAARRYIAATRRDGDLVAAAPLWADPLARLHFAGLIDLRDAARPDATRHARALVATLRGGSHPDFQGWRVAGERSFGAITVRTLVNPRPARVLYDFADHLRPPDATVFRGTTSEGAAPCAFRAGQYVAGGGLGQGALAGPERFACTHEGWNYVGVTILEDMDHRGRRCIWSHPAPGVAMVTHFANVPLGTVLHGHHGIAYEAERGDDLGNTGAPVELRVLVDGRPVGSDLHHDGEGWKTFDFDTRTFAGSRHEVTFEVRSENTGMRHYCFEGDTR